MARFFRAFVTFAADFFFVTFFLPRPSNDVVVFAAGLTAVFLTAGFLTADFLTADFLTADFLTADFFFDAVFLADLFVVASF